MGRKPTVNNNLPLHMRARKQRSGKVYYYYDTGAKPRKEIPLGPNYAEAIKKWAELEIGTGPSQKKITTFKDVTDLYVRDVLPSKAPRTRTGNMVELGNLLKFFNDPPAPIDEIKPVHVRQYLNWRKDAPIRANREKALLSHIFNKAREWGYTDQPNPCAGIRGFKEDGRDVYVDNELYTAIWREADVPTQEAMDLAYLTGQRPADVLKMNDTNIKENRLHVTQNKRGKKLRININGELKALLDRISERKKAIGNNVVSLNILVNENGQRLSYFALDNRFEKARTAAAEKATKAGNLEFAKAIVAVQFRDLRARAGTDVDDIHGIQKAKELLGHENEKMTGHYVRNKLGKIVNPTK